MIRTITAGPNELYAVIDCAAYFTDESGWGFEFDEGRARTYIWRYISAEDADVLLITVDGIIQAGALVAASYEVSPDPLCYIAKFFVLPGGRRTGVSRKLLDFVVEWAQSRSCTHVFSTATAGLPDKEQRLAVNLLKRSGFRETGPTMVKEL